MIFNKILDGLYYYGTCILCDGNMSINNDGFNYQPAYNNCGFNLVFNLDKMDRLVVDPISESVYINYEPEELLFYNNDVDDFKNIYGYNDCFTTIIKCKNCDKFAYSIDIHIDLYDQKILHSNLNDITCNYKEKYWIMNNYYQNTTTLLNDVNDELIKVPLITLEKQNINYIFNRLQKLIIFS